MEDGIITRSQLIEVADEAIVRAETYACELSAESREGLMDVARTVTRMNLMWWDPEEDCGCLVGTYLRRACGVATPNACYGLEGAPVGSDLLAMSVIGGSFLGALNDADIEAGGFYNNLLTVVEDESANVGTL